MTHIRKASHHRPYFVIRCITIQKKGFGNLNRCIVIAKLLIKKFQILFVIDKNTKAKQLLTKNKFHCKELTKSTNEVFYLDKLHNKLNFPMMLIDVREHGESLAKKLYKKNFLLIQFDDAWCKNIFSDIYFNGLPNKTKNSFVQKNSNAKIFIGSKFWISDNQFHLNKKSVTSITKKSNYVVTISMGGSDPHNTTLRILNQIKSIPNISIYVIVGPFFTDMWNKQIKHYDNTVIIKNNFSLWKIFLKSDIVICSAGNTIFDLISQRVPTLCIPLVYHQKQYCNFLHFRKISFSLSTPRLSRTQTKEILKSFLDNPNKRKKLVKNGACYFDGKGASRVVSKILQFSKITN